MHAITNKNYQAIVSPLLRIKARVDGLPKVFIMIKRTNVSYNKKRTVKTLQALQ